MPPLHKMSFPQGLRFASLEAQNKTRVCLFLFIATDLVTMGQRYRRGTHTVVEKARPLPVSDTLWEQFRMTSATENRIRYNRKGFLPENWW